MRKSILFMVSLLVTLSLLAACATPTPEVIEKVVTQVVKETVVQKEVVKETVIIEGTPQVVEKEACRTWLTSRYGRSTSPRVRSSTALLRVTRRTTQTSLNAQSLSARASPGMTASPSPLPMWSLRSRP
jgi:hypothetical protein